MIPSHLTPPHGVHHDPSLSLRRAWSVFILNQMYAKANTARSAAKGKACTVRVAAEMAVTGAGVGTMVGAGVGLGQRVGQKPQGYTYGSYAGPSQ